jgi:hypothetical protein
MKYVFRFFQPFRARLTSKFAKYANMTQQIIFSIFLTRKSKNAEFDAEFESVEKEAKKFTQRKF